MNKMVPANVFAKLTVDSSVVPQKLLPDILKGRLNTGGIKCNSVLVNGIGRKSVNLRVKFVSDALRGCSTIGEAAAILGISRGTVYNIIPNPKKYLRGKT